MLFVSTTIFVSALAVFATMTGLVHATGPQTQCIGMSSFPCLAGQCPRELTGRSLDLIQRSIASRMSHRRVPSIFPIRANCICSLAFRQDNATCAAIEQQTEVTPTALESMNPVINCKFLEGVSYRTRFQEQRADWVVFPPTLQAIKAPSPRVICCARNSTPRFARRTSLRRAQRATGCLAPGTSPKPLSFNSTTMSTINATILLSEIPCVCVLGAKFRFILITDPFS